MLDEKQVRGNLLLDKVCIRLVVDVSEVLDKMLETSWINHYVI